MPSRRARPRPPSQRPCARSTSSISSRTAPRPPRGRADPVHGRPDLRDGIGRRRRQAAARQAPADRAGRRPCTTRLPRSVRHRSGSARTPSACSPRPAGRCGRRAAPRDAPWRPDDRADSRPTGRPARWAQTIAAPSLMWKPLDSLPSACITTTPSVSTPSTSKSSSRMRRARSSTVMCALSLAIRPSACATDRAGARRLRRAVGVDDDDRRDLARFHDLQRFDRQQPPIDRHRLPRHHLAGRQRRARRRSASSGGAGRRR